MKLSQVGELGFIKHIRRRFAQGDQSLLMGIGDDAAVLSSASCRLDSKDLLLTTDVLVEGVDFDFRNCTFHQVGFKALAANLSDIAAMGGAPRYFLVTLGFSGKLTVVQLDQLYEGMADLAHDYKLKLIGGDISAAPGGLFVCITVVGEIEKGRAVVRSGAKVGDFIFVTGTLGDSAAGLELAKIIDRSDHLHRSLAITSLLPLLQRHFYPIPRIHEGRQLSARRIASAMIDLSDGLASDLRHLCEESGVGAVVEAAALPLSPALVEYARQVRRDPLDYAFTGGEDFELLLTVPEGRVARLMQLVRQERIKVSQIGRVFPRASGIRLKGAGGRRLPFPRRGYEHFA